MQQPSAALARVDHHEAMTKGDFGDEHMRIVREAFALGATQQEFEVLWAGAKNRGLDPVRKQIYFVRRFDTEARRYVWASQVSVDGFRSMAEATGQYDGQDEPDFECDATGAPILARVRIYRKGISRPFVGVARYDEFVQTTKDGDPTSMWRKMRFNQLAKCAEVAALRRAFPESLSGLEVPEEVPTEDTRTARDRTSKGPRLAPAPVAQQLPAARMAPTYTAKDAVGRIERATTTEELGEVVASARKWPKVRATAWKKMLLLVPSAEELSHLRELYHQDELPEDLVGKLDETALAQAQQFAPKAAPVVAEELADIEDEDAPDPEADGR